MPAKNAKVSHKGAGGGSVPIPARGSGNKQGSAKMVGVAKATQARQGKAGNSAVKGTTGGKASKVVGNRGKGIQGKR